MLVPCYWYAYFFIIYHAWPTLRGRWTLSHFHVTTCYYSDLLVSCYLLTHVYHLDNHVYHLTSSVLSHDHLACHYLARPSCYVMTYPDYCQSIVMFGCLLISPPCHAIFKTKHDVLDFVIIMFTGILSCYYGTKCHTEQSATPSSVGATSWICGGHL